MKKLIAIGLAGVIGVVLAVQVGRAIHRKMTQKAAPSIEDIQKEEGVPVRVGRVMKADLVASFWLDGVIASVEQASVMANIGGRIRAIHVDEADQVNGGENPTLLVEMDDRAFQALRDAAGKAYDEARENRTRGKALLDSGGLSRQGYAQLTVVEEQARAAFAAAEDELRECRVYAPISGTVSRRYVDPGAAVAKGGRLVDIVDTSVLEVELSLPERDIVRVHKGQGCRVHIGAMAVDEPVKTSVTSLNPALDPVSRTLTARCRLPALTPRPVPGMFARVEILESSREGVPAVPESVIVTLEGQRGVYVVNGEDKIAFRGVQFGLAGGDRVEVTDGLTSEDRIVFDGMSRVTVGDKARIVEE